jgi:hypothetical protein
MFNEFEHSKFNPPPLKLKPPAPPANALQASLMSDLHTGGTGGFEAGVANIYRAGNP